MGTMSPALNTGRSATPLIDRINAMQDRTNSPMICPDCQGSYFYKVSAEQFSDAGYGSAAFRSLSMTTESVYVCLCGSVMDVKESAGKSQIDRHSQFIQVLKAAIALQKKNDPQAIAALCATVQEVEDLTSRVKWLEDAIDILTQAEEVSELEVPEEPEPITIEQISKPSKPGRSPKKEKDGTKTINSIEAN